MIQTKIRQRFGNEATRHECLFGCTPLSLIPNFDASLAGLIDISLPGSSRHLLSEYWRSPASVTCLLPGHVLSVQGDLGCSGSTPQSTACCLGISIASEVRYNMEKCYLNMDFTDRLCWDRFCHFDPTRHSLMPCFWDPAQPPAYRRCSSGTSARDTEQVQHG